MITVDRPLIQYVIDEASAAEIEEFIFVTSRCELATTIVDALRWHQVLRSVAKWA